MTQQAIHAVPCTACQATGYDDTYGMLCQICEGSGKIVIREKSYMSLRPIVTGLCAGVLVFVFIWAVIGIVKGLMR